MVGMQELNLLPIKVNIKIVIISARGMVTERLGKKSRIILIAEPLKS